MVKPSNQAHFVTEQKNRSFLPKRDIPSVWQFLKKSDFD
jgi:hypothetical protein